VYDTIYDDNTACPGFGACGNVHTIYSTTTTADDLSTAYDSLHEDRKACTGFGSCGNVYTIYSTELPQSHVTYDALYEENRVCTGYGECGNIHTVYTTYTEVINNGIDTELVKLVSGIGLLALIYCALLLALYDATECNGQSTCSSLLANAYMH
jgi:hypothetical protein